MHSQYNRIVNIIRCYTAISSMSLSVEHLQGRGGGGLVRKGALFNKTTHETKRGRKEG